MKNDGSGNCSPSDQDVPVDWGCSDYDFYKKTTNCRADNKYWVHGLILMKRFDCCSDRVISKIKIEYFDGSNWVFYNDGNGEMIDTG